MDSFLLTNDALMQAVFHLEQLGALGFHHLAHRYAGPLRQDLGDVIYVDHFIQLVFLFPFVAIGVELFFKPQPFGFHARCPFIVTFHTCQLLFRFQAIQLRFCFLQFWWH